MTTTTHQTKRILIKGNRLLEIHEPLQHQEEKKILLFIVGGSWGNYSILQTKYQNLTRILVEEHGFTVILPKISIVDTRSSFWFLYFPCYVLMIITISCIWVTQLKWPRICAVLITVCLLSFFLWFFLRAESANPAHTPHGTVDDACQDIADIVGWIRRDYSPSQEFIYGLGYSSGAHLLCQTVANNPKYQLGSFIRKLALTGGSYGTELFVRLAPFTSLGYWTVFQGNKSWLPLYHVESIHPDVEFLFLQPEDEFFTHTKDEAMFRYYLTKANPARKVEHVVVPARNHATIMERLNRKDVFVRKLIDFFFVSNT